MPKKILHISTSKNVQRCVYLYTCYSNRVYLHGYCSLLFIILIIYSLSLSLVSVISPHSPFLHLIKSSSIVADHLLLAIDKSSNHTDLPLPSIIEPHRSNHQTKASLIIKPRRSNHQIVSGFRVGWVMIWLDWVMNGFGIEWIWD